MFSNHSVLDLPTCGYSDAFVKRFIKKKPIDDMLENDFPDPWYISSHIVIASEHLPWLQSPPPPVPNNKPSSSVLPRRRRSSSIKKRTVPVRTSSKHLQQQPLSPLPTTPTTPATISSETSTLPTLPSPSSSSSNRPSSTIRGKQQSTETIMQWMDQRLSQRPLSRSPPNNKMIQEQQQQQQQQSYKPSTAPSRAPSIAKTTTRRRRSSSLSSEVSRVLASLPISSSTTLPDQQQQQQNGRRCSHSSLALNNKKLNKFDAAEWPHVLSQTTDEQDRMVAQHYILRTAFDGDFAAPIRTNLDKGSVVLDIGCGPGTWCMEMATEFPRSTFIGIDRVSNYPRDIKPKNCIFRTCSVQNLPLPFPDNSVDYIFQRDLNWDLQAHQWSPLVREFLRVLKPGGWIELVEPDLETQSSKSQECAMNDKLIYGISLRHQDPYVSRHLSSILAANGFRRVESHFQSLPLGWTSDEDDNKSTTNNARLAKAAASHHMFTLQSLQSWLSAVMGNMSAERYNNYIAELPAEWKRGQTYINWHRAVAQKPPSKLQ
ncbi:S-adenosyl-L-methionine-dependent methyltransferase [Zychaea mexicana]|uniref:S-adenosyl-L-methionine-dependent methyltransferase n=1 Tax=Zychaea mexicana TaxID=64656 RepID=UPI0022FE5AF5|nr:S-adenosyl-L-methionine-dependent methyltransferase [Zychaea mexicana]KAI9498012.1 S-adenosyl-L-methionine-dependent methyltransferase [Zychaea mexicana]